MSKGKRILSLVLALMMVMSVVVVSAAVPKEIEYAYGVNYADSALYNVDVFGSFHAESIQAGIHKSMLNSTLVRTDVGAEDSFPPASVQTIKTNVSKLKNMAWSFGRTSNLWFAVDLGAERDIAAIELVQNFAALKDYRVFTTNDTELWNEMYNYYADNENMEDALDHNKEPYSKRMSYGLSEKGRAPFMYKEGAVTSVEDMDNITETSVVPETNKKLSVDGIIDKLGDPVASGTVDTHAGETYNGVLNGPTIVSNGIRENDVVDTINFPEHKARYVVFVVDSIYTENRLGFWSFRVLGKADDKVSIAQYPSEINYADQTKYSSVTIKRANTKGSINTATGMDTVKYLTYGDPKVMVNSELNYIATGYNSNTAVIGGNGDGTSDTVAEKEFVWCAIDLGQVRHITDIELYQGRYNMKQVNVYSITQDEYEYLNSDRWYTDYPDTSESNNAGRFITSNHDMLKHQNLLGSFDTRRTDADGTALATNTYLNLDNDGNRLFPGVSGFNPENVDKLDVKDADVQYLLLAIKTIKNGLLMNYIKVLDSKADFEHSMGSNESLDYTAKLYNGTDNATVQKSVIVAQYGEGDAFISADVQSVDIPKGKGMEVTKNITFDNDAKTVKVFTWSLDGVKPVFDMYTITK